MWLLPILLACVSLTSGLNLNVEYEWIYFDYVWQSDAQKTESIANGVYNKSRIVLNEFELLPDGSVLVTLPKWRGDNPASIGTISEESGEGGRLVKPYPDWAAHSTTDCSGITNIDRVRRDASNRLWAVDTGRVLTEQRCQPKVISFDLTTNTILDMVEIPDGTFVLGGILDIQAIDWTPEDPDNVTLYISDYRLGAMLIYNSGNIWRLENSVFKADPEHVILNIDTEVFNLTAIGGNLGTIAIPYDGYFANDWIIFKPAASVKLFFVLRDELLASRSGSPVTYYVSDYTMENQQLYEMITPSGIMFGSASTEMTITCWNIKNPLTTDYMHIFETDAARLNYVFGFKLEQVTDGDVVKEKIWASSNLILKFFDGTMDFDSNLNFFIVSGYVEDIIAGTSCDAANVAKPACEYSSASTYEQNLSCDVANIGLSVTN